MHACPTSADRCLLCSEILAQLALPHWLRVFERVSAHTSHPTLSTPASRTQVLRHHTRKTPNGEGSKTWDFYELRIHKRLIDLQTSSETLRQILNINIETGVQVDVTIHNG
jgi:ribosomal protein S10